MPSAALHPTGCWFAATLGPSIGPCDGRLIRAHLIPKQVIKRELGAYYAWDKRTFVMACGGPTGIGGHHGAFDYARTVRVPRHLLPAAVEQFASEHGLGWRLDHDFGPLEAAA